MDNTVKYLEPIPRQFPNSLQAIAVGYLHKTKNDRINSPFNTYNFSFILEGEGNYSFGEQTIQFNEPSAFIQWPDAPMNYGPFERWTEFYIIYDATNIPKLQEAHFDRNTEPLWKIRQPTLVQTQVDQILSLLRNWDDSHIDTLDRLCELLIIASLTQSSEAQTTDSSDRIDQARFWMEAHYNSPIAIDAIADRFGFAPITFRRHWTKRIGSPPTQYLTRLRMQKARLLLVETDLPISTISRQVGYEDPLYFSRRFRQEIHNTPTQYRRENQPTIQTPRLDDNAIQDL